MQQVAHAQAARLQLGHDGVDEERHVVVEDLDGGAGRAAIGCLRVADAQLVLLPRLVGDELQRRARLVGKPCRGGAVWAFQAIAGEQQRRKLGCRRALAQQLLHVAQDAGFLAGRCLGHGVFSLTVLLSQSGRRWAKD